VLLAIWKDGHTTGLIACIESQGKLRYPVPNSTFKPDWDHVQAIVWIRRKIQMNVMYTHVKGHQDTETPVEELDLMWQLNVEANRYAADYRRQYGSHRPLIPLMPTRLVALDINGRTIHRRFKQSIREAIHGPHLLEEMQLRYDWPDGTTIESIDWEAHRQAAQAQNLCHSHYLKLCHNLLPTVSQLTSHRKHCLCVWPRPPQFLAPALGVKIRVERINGEWKL
jgi:hypothetical protein